MKHCKVLPGLLVLAAAGGCGSAGQTSKIGVDRVTVLATSPTDSAMEALDGGVLAVVDGCLGPEANEGREPPVVSWAQGSEPLEDQVGVQVPDGRVFVLGDEVTFGGGHVGATASEAEACGWTAEVWRVGDIPRRRGTAPAAVRRTSGA